MVWTVRFYDAFEEEFQGLAEEVQEELLACARLLQEYGPHLGRPRVDTINGSDYTNMKELRFDAADGVWRVAFAFDPNRQAVLLVAGDKSGGSESKFYKRLLKAADERYSAHLETLRAVAKKGK
jgi:hypothetical protein